MPESEAVSFWESVLPHMQSGARSVFVARDGERIVGTVQIAFESIILSIDHIKTRKLRALAVTEATPSDVLPSVPPMNRFVPGFEASAWFGIVAPKGTPIGVVETLNREINAGLADPALRARLAALGSTAFASSPADFGKFIAEETQKWRKVVRFSGAKPD